MSRAPTAPFTQEEADALESAYIKTLMLKVFLSNMPGTPVLTYALEICSEIYDDLAAIGGLPEGDQLDEFTAARVRRMAQLSTSV